MLTIIFQKSLNAGDKLTRWKTTRLVTIYKNALNIIMKSTVRFLDPAFVASYWSTLSVLL